MGHRVEFGLLLSLLSGAVFGTVKPNPAEAKKSRDDAAGADGMKYVGDKDL